MHVAIALSWSNQAPSEQFQVLQLSYWEIVSEALIFKFF